MPKPGESTATTSTTKGGATIRRVVGGDIAAAMMGIASSALLPGESSRTLTIEKIPVSSGVVLNATAAGCDSQALALVATKKSSVGNGDIIGIIEIAKAEAARNGLEVALVLGVIECESNWNIMAGSSTGAQGLMQLMPATARAYGATNLYDPNQNIATGCKVLKDYITQFGSEELGIAAYNAGPGNVRKAGGIPNISETIRYVQCVTDRKNKFLSVCQTLSTSSQGLNNSSGNTKLAQVAESWMNSCQGPTAKGRCQSWVRQVCEVVYQDRYRGITGTAETSGSYSGDITAKAVGNAWISKKPSGVITIETSDVSQAIPGDLVYKRTGSGGAGHVGILINGGLIAENSSTSYGRKCGAIGYRYLILDASRGAASWFGRFDLLVRLPSV